MGKNLVIKGADFSKNAVVLPEVVELTSLSGAYAVSSSAVIGQSFDTISWTSGNWPRWEAEIDVDTYNYTSKAFKQTSGSNYLLNVWILDENRIIIDKKSVSTIEGVMVVPEFTINSENYPTAKYIGFCTNVQSSDPIYPTLIREGKG